MAIVSRRLWRPLLIACVVIAAMVAGFLYLTRQKPVAVLVAGAEAGRVEMTVANTRAGSVAACRRAKIAPPAAGRIEKLPVKKGQRVAAGELLLELWNDDFSARERVSREQLATARARVTEACQLAEAAKSEARRARQLRDQNFVSEQAVIRAEADAQSRAATCEATRTSVGEAQARIAASHADTERTVLRAPFAGIVAEINGEIGEYLTPSPPGIPTLPAIDLIDDSCIYVTAPIDEVDAAQLKVGMKGRITLDAYRGRQFTGHVRRIAPYVLALEKQARTVEVEVEFDDPGEARHLLIGYSADIEVVVQGRDKVLRIPTSALMPNNRVLQLTAAGVLEEKKLGIGLTNWEFTEVTSGLAQGDKVVTSLDREGVKAGARAVAEAKGNSGAATGGK
ncbi:efflux RND transporter periplasmic adaptor subunit [Sulfurisoma sediminicola]|uniref:HlyD family secretion protein n=1 Tax=Sulfurisoma sediminicola TaxID=1381557 RepID=A0A497X7E6_9PROT|nr:efflux RND transporter periplasmic adaptor subunit [Sulfurisoma sediminicola]RLJ61629.1 HlyD family secretion protein [Sulfurisoma sediminicola]